MTALGRDVPGSGPILSTLSTCITKFVYSFSDTATGKALLVKRVYLIVTFDLKHSSSLSAQFIAVYDTNDIQLTGT